MTLDDVKQANELIAQIEKTKSLIEAYRTADVEIIVGLKQQHRLGAGESVTNKLELRPQDIADRIVEVLERRIEAWEGQLAELGVTT
jgi:hypothetical protein